MAPITVLRTLIIVELVSALLGTYADFALQSTFPLELQVYLSTQWQGPFGVGDVVKGVVFVALIVAIVVASVGLWYVKRWARTLYTTLVVISLVLTLFLGPVVTSAFAAALYSISTIASGVTLGLIWFSELRGKFEAQRER